MRHDSRMKKNRCLRYRLKWTQRSRLVSSITNGTGCCTLIVGDAMTSEVRRRFHPPERQPMTFPQGNSIGSRAYFILAPHAQPQPGQIHQPLTTRPRKAINCLANACLRPTHAVALPSISSDGNHHEVDVWSYSQLSRLHGLYLVRRRWVP